MRSAPTRAASASTPASTRSILKFLAFEQTFKNALTGLPMGGGKGGANFNPKGKSDGEIMRFCQSFMTELYRHIGADVDVPAGDIGVGAREIGYMFGQYKRITNSFEGVLTGKGLEYGGSLIRTEATGYGAVYFLENMLKTRGQDLAGKRAVISGSGNVATHAAEKIVQLGGKVLTLSDSEGFVHDPDGIDQEKIDWVKAHKTRRRGRISEYADEYQGRDLPRRRAALGRRHATSPCPARPRTSCSATDARTLVANGCIAVSEGANMPTDLEGVHVFRDAKLLYAPGKASNAGGVAVSGLEMSQNRARISWKEEQLQQLLRGDHGRHPRRAASNMATAAAAMSTTSRAPTSPASRRSPTRCWRSGWSERRPIGLSGQRRGCGSLPRHRCAVKPVMLAAPDRRLVPRGGAASPGQAGDDQRAGMRAR